MLIKNVKKCIFMLYIKKNNTIIVLEKIVLWYDLKLVCQYMKH